MAQSKDGNVTTEFKQIRITSDIPKFLDAVEQEAIRILEANDLPIDGRFRDEIIYETINDRKLIDAVKESDGDFEFRIPTSIYQAKRILILALGARWHIKQSEFHDELNLARDGLAFMVGEIVRVMYLNRLPVFIGIDSPKSTGSAGKKWPSAVIIENAIKSTARSKEHWEFNGNDVLDTLREEREFIVDEFTNQKGNLAFSLTYNDESGEPVTIERTVKTIDNKIPRFKK
jgi:hypothetical protein